jgi:hypothetical protein
MHALRRKYASNRHMCLRPIRSLFSAVTLSKVKKKTKEWKGGLIVNAHKLLAEYEHCLAPWLHAPLVTFCPGLHKQETVHIFQHELSFSKCL